jgi:DNA-binding HxlR family transcriptional regulator
MAAVRRPGAYVCGIDAAMDVIGGKWKVLILWALSERPHRFGELRRSVPGVTEKVLAAQLRELEADGIVHREDYDEVPPRVEYSLTSRGADLNTALEPLGAWGRRNVIGDAYRGTGGGTTETGRAAGGVAAEAGRGTGAAEAGRGVARDGSAEAGREAARDGSAAAGQVRVDDDVPLVAGRP